MSIALLATAVAYEPVRRVFVANSQPQHPGLMLAKAGWTGLKAIKTGGISLAFDAGKMFFGAQRERQRFEEFQAHLKHALRECESLRETIRAAQHNYRGILGNLSRKMTYQVIFGLAPVYGELPPSEQEALAESLSAVAELPFPCGPNLLERGDEAARRREEAQKAAERKAARREQWRRIRKWWLKWVAWPLVTALGVVGTFVCALIVVHIVSGNPKSFADWLTEFFK